MTLTNNISSSLSAPFNFEWTSFKAVIQSYFGSYCCRSFLTPVLKAASSQSIWTSKKLKIYIFPSIWLSPSAAPQPSSACCSSLTLCWCTALLQLRCFGLTFFLWRPKSSYSRALTVLAASPCQTMISPQRVGGIGERERWKAAYGCSLTHAADGTESLYYQDPHTIIKHNLFKVPPSNYQGETFHVFSTPRHTDIYINCRVRFYIQITEIGL